MILNTDDFFKNIDTTSSLSIMNFFKKYDKQFFEKHNIYVERHHIYPKAETKKEIELFVYLPIKYHFLVHYLRAKEYELNGEMNLAKINYAAARLISVFKRDMPFEEIFKNDFEILYRSVETKLKFNSLSSGKNHPLSSPVINLQSLEIHETFSSALKNSNYNKQRLLWMLKDPVKFITEHTKPKCIPEYWARYDETKDISFYKSLFKKLNEIPWKKKKQWSDENLKKRAEKVKGKKLITKRSKQITLDGITFDSITRAMEASYSKSYCYKVLKTQTF